MAIRHKFRSAISDDGLPQGGVKPSNWNDEHDIDGLLGALLAVDVAPDMLPYLDASMQGRLAQVTQTGREILACALVSDVLNYLGAASIVNPALGGTPTAPTAPVGTYSNQIATMAAIRDAISALVGGAPGALDTLNELAVAINDDANFAATMTNKLAVRLAVDAAQSFTAPQLTQGRANLGLGSAAVFDVGTTANKIVQLDSGAKLPAIDGSQLLGVVAAWAAITGKPTFGTASALNVGTSANQVVQLDASARLPAVDGSQLTNVGGATRGGDLNKFRNGALDVWQRGASLTIAPGGGYTADGWIVLPAGASVAVAQAAGVASTLYSLKVTGATGVTGCVIKQRIESYIAAPLNGKTVTVQAKIVNNTGASITPTLTVKHATAADNWGATTTDVNAVALQACANGSTTQVAYTFAASASSSNGLDVAFDFGNNLGALSKSIQIAELDISITPAATIGINAAPPAPELRPIFVELPFNQRYFYSSYQNGQAPGSAISGGAAGMFGLGYQGAASGFSFLAITSEFPVQMRTAPSTVSCYDNAGALGKISYYNGSTWNNGGAGIVNGLIATGVNIGANNIAGTTAISFMYTASAELAVG